MGKLFRLLFTFCPEAGDECSKVGRPRMTGSGNQGRFSLRWRLTHRLRYAEIRSWPIYTGCLEKAVMLNSMRIIHAAAVIVLGATDAMAIEEASYEVVEKDGRFEVRDYAPHILAETIVDGDREEAGGKAFRRLFRYISGENRSREKVAMTAPVSQEPRGEEIKMTAPVGQQRVEGQWAISFMMPSTYTLESLPEPKDQSISLRQVPARRMAAVRYSGFWSEKSYRRHRQALESWIHDAGLTVVGEAVWARYNPPFTPWFLRRNEILIPVDARKD